MSNNNPKFSRPKFLHVCLGAALVLCAGSARSDEQQLLEKIKKLEDRVAELEGKSPAAPENANSWKDWLGSTKFEGFVSASYLYNFNRAKTVTGRTFDVDHNEFMLNKLKLTLERPIEYSATKWDVGYRADFIVGEDAKVIQPINGPTLGDAADYEQVFITANVPIGRGLQVSAGRMVTLLGVEVIEETQNPNWSEGNQFIFAENATSTGLQLAYKWTDKLDTQVRLINGWDVVKDNNNALSLMGRIGYAPDERTSLALVGYGGPEQGPISRNADVALPPPTDLPPNNGAWRKGVELVFSRKITPALTVWAQGDYGREDASPQLVAITGNRDLATHDAQWWAGGLWLTYDFSERIGIALRGDYFHDEDGARTSASPLNAPFPPNSGQDLTSLTATLNLRPLKHLQVRPEVRWDHSDLGSGAFGSHSSPTGRKNQVTALIGAAYLF